MEPAGRWEGKGLEALGLDAGSVVDPDTLRNLFTKRIHPVSGEVLGRKPHEFKKLEEEIEAQVDALMARGAGPVAGAAPRADVHGPGRGGPGARQLLRRRFLGAQVGRACCRSAGSRRRRRRGRPGTWTGPRSVRRRPRRSSRPSWRRRRRSSGSPSSTSTSAPGITARRRGSGGTPPACLLRSSCITRRAPRKGEAVGDPQLHAHIAIWAYAQRGDGADSTYRSIDAAGLYQMQSYYAAVARAGDGAAAAAAGVRDRAHPRTVTLRSVGLHDPKVIKHVQLADVRRSPKNWPLTCGRSSSGTGVHRPAPRCAPCAKTRR